MVGGINADSGGYNGRYRNRLAHELNEADEESQYYTFRGCVQVLHAIFRLFERTFLMHGVRCEARSTVKVDRHHSFFEQANKQ